MPAIILVLTGIALLVAGSTFLHGAVISPLEETTPLHETDYSLAVERDAPSRLKIPSIEVDAAVEHVGIAPSGNMAVPYQYEHAGWYRSGPAPGEQGSAVMDGHVDTGFGGPAVFARIGELNEGDRIYVESKDGTTLTFAVEEVADYAYDDVPKDQLFLRDDAPRLNLITCAGTWDQSARSYDRRTVVYTRLVIE